MTKFKTNLRRNGTSKFILVPAFIVKYEGLRDDEVLEIEIKRTNELVSSKKVEDASNPILSGDLEPCLAYL